MSVVEQTPVLTPDPALSTADDAFRRLSRWQRIRASWFASPTLIVALGWLVLMLVAAAFPALLATHDPLIGSVPDKLQPPAAGHWFGTDQLGRDIYSRAVYGARITIEAVAIALALGLSLGTLAGLLSGFAGGAADAVIMRLADVLLSIPNLLLSLAVIVALGFGTVNVAIAVGIGTVASVARVMRAEVLKVKQAPFVEAARAGGARWTRVLRRHGLPNALGPVIVMGVLEFGQAILAISALSFLGYGATPPTPEWGAMVSEGRTYLAAQPWLSTLPGLVIALTVLATNRVAHVLGRPGGPR